MARELRECTQGEGEVGGRRGNEGEIEGMRKLRKCSHGEGEVGGEGEMRER